MNVELSDTDKLIIASKHLEVEALIYDVQRFVNERTKDFTAAQRTVFLALQYVQNLKALYNHEMR